MIRWKITTGNRVGMVYDVLRVFAEENISIISMEVIPEQIHLKIERLNQTTVKKLKQKLFKIPEVYNIESVEVMPQEEREQQLRTVLDSISEGIIAINREGRITTLNPASEKIFHCPQEKLLNQPIQEFLGEEVPIISCLREGKSYDNKEMMIDTPEGRSHYLTSGRPIRDEHGNVIGAVAVMKDIHQVRQLIYKMTQPSMITFDDIIYQSQAMQQVVKLAEKAARSNSTILIRGESGTGKELFARAIHMSSMRRDKPFIPINCGALPDSLLESELFGYEEGTFTGARKGGKQGLFELAQGGTLFLDEIGELPTHLQVKLLRVLQEGKVRRLGSSKEQTVDVRIISATNKNLEKMVQHKEFREDLYYRLNVIPINIPPLRQRREDIPLLIDYFLQLFSREVGKSDLKIEDKAMKGLLEYDWPGNVRELRNAIERAVYLTNNNRITWSDLFPEQPELNKSNAAVEVKINRITALEEVVAAAERSLLQKVVKEYNSSRQMGKVLGVSHTTVLNKLKKYNLL
ncbi:Fis family transcriptional regulator [Anoxybacter fermentans]|uniref:HTH-type transcriptional regulatory protein TyrR n=1 Tax=Anoxybacter fermentans TaxID=1323375 RepID=A0A3Q9HPE2_9FIRM|nr:sigma 54-interacting transcriptional regulator [Anoxybacter fermentans]AZR72558.1 Fis family transcriptional regulator [Anoxybacter fermentans]